LSAARILQVPVLVTEQNPRALGATVAEVDLQSVEAKVLPKTKFSMYVPEIEAEMKRLQTKSVVLYGIESHVCVLQTALEILETGRHVYVLADGVSSANRAEIPIALSRLRSAGAVVTTSESILFQLLHDSNHEKFRAISGLIKEHKDRTKDTLETLVSSSL
ncbi:Isochorismatase-like protein, partial [Blyttiomyces helicus]